jgi:hypothetical protein
MTEGARKGRVELGLAAGGAVVLALLQWWPAFERPLSTGFGDWQMIHHNWEAARIALARFGEWPLWDPFHCGGVTILGNPESQVYSPLFWLSFVTGSVIASKLFVVAHVACALLGMFVLARREYGCGVVAACFAASVWALSGFFAWHGAGGHATFLPFAFAPLVVLCFRRGLHDVRYVVATAALLALTLLEGGTYPFPYLVLLLGLELGRALLIDGPSRARAALVARKLLLLAGLTILLGGVRLLPVVISLADNPRQVESTDSLTLSEVWLMLTAREHPWRFPPHPYVWPEYGTYVGYFVPLLGLAGALACAYRGPRHLLVGVACFGALMLGSPAPWFPWPLLHELPVYDSLRVPSRFAVLFTFYLALLGAVAIELVLTRLRGRGRIATGLAALLLAGQTADVLIVNHDVVDRWRGTPVFAGPPMPAFYMVKERGYHEAYASYPQRNIGTPLCYVGGMDWSVSPALWDGPMPQARVMPEDAGRVLTWNRSTRRLSAEVELRRPATLIWNQNHAPGFETSAGRLRSDRGLIAVDLPAGRATVQVRYAPSWLVPSVSLTVAGLALGAVLLRRRSKLVR